MLPARARLRHSRDFTAVLHRAPGNIRVGRPLLVAHVSLGQPETPAQTPPASLNAVPARAGFVVSRAVGGAVVRNRVRRRLRALTAERLDRLPPGCRLVLRATPRAADASSAALGRELDAALATAFAAAGQRRTAATARPPQGRTRSEGRVP